MKKIAFEPAPYHKPLPRQLKIENGKLVTLTGDEPNFEDLPDMEITLFSRESASTMYKDLNLLVSWGA